MKKKQYLFGIAFMASLAFACSLSGNQAGGEDELPEETRIVLTVESSYLTSTAEAMSVLISEQETEAAAAEPTQADGADSATQAPDEGDASPPSDTPESSPTPTQTPTQTPPATSTAPAGDPKSSLGNPNWSDDFDNGANWFTYEDSTARAEVKDDTFIYTMFSPQFGEVWTVSWPVLENHYLEVSAKTPAECSGNDRYGLFFRAPDPSAGYLFAVSCEGRYRLSVWDGSSETVLQDWLPNAAVNAGPNQTNRLGIMWEGKKIGLYVNGKLLFETEDDTLGESGRFGLLIGSANTDNFGVAFDDIAYWELP